MVSYNNHAIRGPVALIRTKQCANRLDSKRFRQEIRVTDRSTLNAERKEDSCRYCIYLVCCTTCHMWHPRSSLGILHELQCSSDFMFGPDFIDRTSTATGLYRTDMFLETRLDSIS